MLIEKIYSPDDVKKMDYEELRVLAEEIRRLLIEKCSKKGGHIGSNLGIVELSIALHYVFKSPQDKIVYDVSHQSYVHKMLTGRAKAFYNELLYDSVSGFTNPDESEHDLFKMGHSSSSISVACGLAKKRDLCNENGNVISIIGDGALSGGQAFEGLDYGGSEVEGNLIIILNDNGMSIAENHGAIYNHLARLRRYDGEHDNNIFEMLGYEYYYIKDGNNLEECINTLSIVKDVKHPVLVHVVTEKGRGYAPAVADKEMWHYRPPFDPVDGHMIRKRSRDNYDDMTCDYLMSKMASDKSVVTMVAGVPLTVGFTLDKRKKAGKQFIDVGIAEQAAISISAGIAKAGGKPVFCTDATFYQRAYDQISQEVCINKCPVTMLVRNASVYGQSDVTHLGFFDIPLLSNIPNLVYLAPITRKEYFEMLEWSIEQKEYPVAIRIPKRDVPDAILNKPFLFDLNKNITVRKGERIAIFAVGSCFRFGMELADKIQEYLGFSPALIHPRYLTGVDYNFVESCNELYNIIITIEDGIVDGGYGEKISRTCSGINNIVLCYGMKKEFVDRYSIQDIMSNNHIDSDMILKDIISLGDGVFWK